MAIKHGTPNILQLGLLAFPWRVVKSDDLMIWGIFLGIRGVGVAPGSKNPDPISDQKIVIFHIYF